jgi:regulation of enolase protein 1 (concanavalin A-like superfamily)
VSHDVYFGTSFADVNTASRTNPKGVLASQGQTAATFDPPGAFAYGQTYYWRVDEVNAAPNTIYKGTVWSFTAEPYAYPITGVTATASSAQAGMGPGNTIDGSGLDKSDLHGIDGSTMWLTTGAQPNWIQYQFDKVYKLFNLKVWNSNQLIESFIGFGAKKVTIEYSTDGTTWTALANVPEFARAPGVAGYAANTTVSFGGVMAKYVKLTINSNWGGMSTVTGLSEVRFSYVPVQAFAPQPATAATGVSVDASLSWRPGREAGSHKVFFGIDQAAVAGGTVAAKMVTGYSYIPSGLNFGTTYYWKVDEVNTVTYPGDVWSFTTQEYAVVDDFESYDDKDNRIYDTWIDGLTNGLSGSQVGYNAAPFAEQTIVHGGVQSMPLEYNNIKTPFYSEAQRTFDTAQSWTTNGADTLSLWFRGYPAGFLDKGNNAFTVSSSGSDIWNAADQFRFVYKSLSGNGSIVAKVDSVVNTNVWAKAGVMIRQSLDTGSAMAYMIQSAASGASFGWRQLAAGTPASIDKAGIVAPQWVKLTRTGNAFTAQYSADGKTWTDIKNADGTVTTTAITMTGTIYIGLCVTSHDATLTTTAEFSNVSTTGTVTGAWQALAIGMTMPSNDPAPLYLTVEDKAGKAKTVVNPNPSASVTAAWTEWRIPLSNLTGVSLTAVKKITLGVGDKTSPKAGGAGMLFIDDLGYGHPVK